MTWDATGYGAHRDKAASIPRERWLFAEGAEGFFSTFLLLVNPQTTANTAHVTYLREGAPPLTRHYPLAPASRFTVVAGDDRELADYAFGAIVDFDLPGVAERAMYFGVRPIWSGGHESMGVNVPSPTWILAEGATGSFFSTYILLANPGTVEARATLNIGEQDATLANAAVATRVDSNQPIVVERAQYWPNFDWYEAHNSFGVTSTYTRWGLAEGRVGGANHAQTYILLVNPGMSRADVTVAFLRANGAAPITKTFVVEPHRRMNIAVVPQAGDVPELSNESLGAVIQSTQPIAVERSMYFDLNGMLWVAGTNATASALPSSGRRQRLQEPFRLRESAPL